MIYAQIMAGGVGSRMGNTERPKQFLELGKTPILIHTLEKFSLIPDFEVIFVSVHPKWIRFAEDLIKKHISDNRIVIVPGGSERNDTVMNVVEYINDHFTLKEDDVLLMHDAVRPFVTRRIIMDNIKQSTKFSAVDTVIGATDTIVKAMDDTIVEIPDRSFMFQGQTPQTVNIKKFRAQYLKMSDSDKKSLTDSIKVMLLAGENVGLVDGDETNIKITKPFDLKIANALVENQNV